MSREEEHTAHGHCYICSFLSVIHLAVGVVYCLASWSVGLPKRSSECFYTAGKSDDLGEVINHLHRTHPETPLYAVGTSLGANLLVKYLGEEGVNVPLVGAVAVSNPWDLLTDMDSTNFYAYISIIVLFVCIPPAIILEGPQLLKHGFGDAIESNE